MFWDSGGTHKAMNTWKRLAALLGATLLLFALFGTTLATHPTASDAGVTPSLHDGNIGLDSGPNKTEAACDDDDAVVTTDVSGEGTSENGVTVTWTYDSETKALSFTSDGLVLIAYVKGGDAYNEYNYSGLGGIDADGNLYAPHNASGGPAGLSHALFCTGPASETSSSSTSFSQTESGTSTSSSSTSFSQTQSGTSDSSTLTQEPTDTIGASGSGQQSSATWLLFAALSVLLGSIIVVAPSRAKTRQ